MILYHRSSMLLCWSHGPLRSVFRYLATCAYAQPRGSLGHPHVPTINQALLSFNELHVAGRGRARRANALTASCCHRCRLLPPLSVALVSATFSLRGRRHVSRSSWQLGPARRVRRDSVPVGDFFGGGRGFGDSRGRLGLNVRTAHTGLWPRALGPRRRRRRTKRRRSITGCLGPKTTRRRRTKRRR